MIDTIAKSYPGTPLGISEWNFGADGTMNGALAIADVLGIYGREGVYMANYWRSPQAQSPGYYAFKMFGNYDDAGSSFVGTTVATTDPSEDIASYAAVDPTTGHLKVMLINKDPDKDADLNVALGSFAASGGTLYRYSSADAGAIAHEPFTASGGSVRRRCRPTRSPCSTSRADPGQDTDDPYNGKVHGVIDAALIAVDRPDPLYLAFRG